VVCEGETLIEPFSIEPKPLEYQSKKNLMSLLVELSELKEVYINPETLVIFEAQILPEGADLKDD